MSIAAELADRLVHEVAGPLSAPAREVALGPEAPAEDAAWAASGARELTCAPDGPPLPVPGAPASATLAALGVVAAYTGAATPGVEVLGERARLAGLRGRAPFSVGGAYRALAARDGWFGLSLSRPADLDLLPALLGVDRVGGDHWAAVADWLAGTTVEEAHDRSCLLGLPAAPVPDRPLAERRAPVLVTVGGPREPSRPNPTVVDLSSLWAGPLCARLLAGAGARVVKVESRDRPDGARQGSLAFWDALHAGQEIVQLDLRRERDRLVDLLLGADVVLEGSRPRALRQLGIVAEEYVGRGTVWVSVTAYGRAGADAMRVGFGDDVAAGAGLVARLDGVPVPVGDAIADPLAGTHAAAATAIALASGRGSLLDVSMHDVAVRAAAARPAGTG